LEKGGERLHNEELQNLYCSQDIIRRINSRRVRSTRHVAGMEMGHSYKI
jgi:hypothetical protein